MTAPATSWIGRLRALLTGSQQGITDVVMMLLPQVAIVVTGFLTTVLIARGLGPSSLGEYSLVLSVAGLTAAFSDMGLGQTAIRFAARAAAEGRADEQFAVLRWAFRMRLVLVSAVAVTAALLAPVMAARLWHAPGLAPLIRLGLLGGVFAALAAFPTVYLQSIRRFGRSAVLQIAQALLGFAGVLAVAALGRWSVEAIVTATMLAAAVGALVFLPMVPRGALVSTGHAPGGARPRRAFWTSPIAPEPELSGLVDCGPGVFAMYNMASTLIVMITLRLDVWLMGVYVPPGQIGLYTVASRFALPLGLVLTAVSGALWPRASSHSDPRQSLVLLRRTFQLSLPLGLLAVLYALVVPLLTPWLFGSAYDGSRLLAHVLCIRYALAILIVPVGVIGYSLGLVRVYWIINLIQLVVVAAVNVLLLPRLGPMASALALVASEIVGVILAGRLLLKRAREIARAPEVDDPAGVRG